MPSEPSSSPRQPPLKPFSAIVLYLSVIVGAFVGGFFLTPFIIITIYDDFVNFLIGAFIGALLVYMFGRNLLPREV